MKILLVNLDYMFLFMDKKRKVKDLSCRIDILNFLNYTYELMIIHSRLVNAYTRLLKTF